MIRRLPAPNPAAGALKLTGALLLTAVGAAACHPAKLGEGRDINDRPLAVADRLTCPERQGDLRRLDVASDGRSCRYAGHDGEEVLLSYLALDGKTPQAALAPMEAQFHALVPAGASTEPGSLAPEGAKWSTSDRRAGDGDGDQDGEDGRHRDEGRDRTRVAEGVPAPPKPPEAPQIDSSWRAHGKSGDEVHVRLPFLSIDADGTGRARIKTLGADIDASDEHAVVHAGWNGSKAEIHANDGGAEMRFGAVGAHRADLTYILASDRAGPEGWRAAAYVAKGPINGPLVVAMGKSREASEDHDDAVHDLKRLVDRNVRRP